MSSNPVRTAFLVSMVMSVAAACGGGGGDERLSREELIEQGDAICTEYESRVDEIEEPQGQEDVARFVDEAKPVVEEGVDELDALTPPEELEDDYDEWIELSRNGVAVLDDLKAAAAEGDDARVEEIVRGLDDEEAEADRIAQDIGFENCGEE
jgi:hypothetical protein